jgi:hypothetical protein
MKGTACTDNGGKVCNDGGKCVKCNVLADCAMGSVVCLDGVCL